MGQFSENTIFWVTLYSEPGHNAQFGNGGIFSNSPEQRKAMRDHLWSHCMVTKDHSMSEQLLDESLEKWQKNNVENHAGHYDSHQELFVIESEEEDNEEVADALRSPDPVTLYSLYAYTCRAMWDKEVKSLMEEGVEEPEQHVTPERVILQSSSTEGFGELEQPSFVAQDGFNTILRSYHPRYELLGNFRVFVGKKKAVKFARDKTWYEEVDYDCDRVGQSRGKWGWAGVVQVKCPIKGDGENTCDLLTRLYTVQSCTPVEGRGTLPYFEKYREGEPVPLISA